MTFDAMIKCSKSNQVFGKNKLMYEKLENLRKLRNRIHLQTTDEKKGTDWTSFNSNNIDETFVVMYSIFISSLFSPTKAEKEYFKYLLDRYTN